MSEHLSTDSEGLFSIKAKGLDGPECRYGGDCELPTTSTGWIRRHPDGNADREWYAEFQCEKHGEVYSRGAPFDELIAHVLADQAAGQTENACSCQENIKEVLMDGRKYLKDLGHVHGFDFDLSQCSKCGRYWADSFGYGALHREEVDAETAARMMALDGYDQIKAFMREWAKDYN